MVRISKSAQRILDLILYLETHQKNNDDGVEEWNNVPVTTR